MAYPCKFYKDGKEISLNEVKKYIFDNYDKIKSESGVPPIEPPKQDVAKQHSELPPFSNLHSDIERIRSSYGFDELETTSESTLKQMKTAYDTIAEWKAKGIYDKEINNIIDKTFASNDISNENQNILAQHIADLNYTLKNATDRYSKEYDNLSKQLDNATSALYKIRSQAGRLLGSIKQFVGQENPQSIVDVESNLRDVYGVDVLTKEQKEQAEKLWQKWQDIYKEDETVTKPIFEKILKLAEEEHFRLIKEETSRDTPLKRKKTTSEYKAERQSIKQSIKEKWKAAGKDLLSSDIPYRKQIVAIAPDVYKLIKSYVEEASDITLDKVKELLKKDIIEAGIEDVTDQEINYLVAGGGLTKENTKNKVVAKIYELKKEQKLLNDYELLQQGIDPTNNKPIPEALKNQKLKQLVDRNENLMRELGYGKYSDQKKFEQAVKLKISANLKSIKELDRRLKEKDYTPDLPKKSIFDSPKLRQENKDLFYKWQVSENKKDELKLEYQKAINKIEQEQEGKFNKLWVGIKYALNTYKGTVASFDRSIVYVQNLLLALAHPLRTLKSEGYAWKDLFKKQSFDLDMNLLHRSKLWDIIQKSGLVIYEPTTLKRELRMEQHGGEYNLWNKTKLGRAIERQNSSFTNNMRLSNFIEQVKNLESQGKTIENSLKDYKDVARVINELSGHGQLYHGLKNSPNVMEVLNNIIWSSKMLASTFNVLGVGDLISKGSWQSLLKPLGAKVTSENKGFYASLSPYGKKVVIKKLGRAMATGTSLLLAAYAYKVATGKKDDELDVELDPHSTNFGNIIVNGDAVSVFGRFSSMASALTIAATGHKKTQAGDTKYLGQRFGDKTSGDVVFGSFVRGKMTPYAGLAYDYFGNQAKNYYTGERMDAEYLSKQFVPLALQDIPNDIKNDGVIKGSAETILKLYGVNVKSKKKFEEESKRIKLEEKEYKKQHPEMFKKPRKK